jgi:hypothetical protein
MWLFERWRRWLPFHLEQSLSRRIAWLTSSRYVFARRRGDLQATQLLIDPADRCRDIGVLDPAIEARVMEGIRERSRARRAGRSGH